MKTSKIILQSAEYNNEEQQKKVTTNKLTKPIFVILMLFWISLMTSCLVSFGGPGHGYYRGYGGDGYGHRAHYGHDDHHWN
jgi:hypothetical protein